MTTHETTWEALCASTRMLGKLLLGQSAVINVALIAVPIYSLQIFDRVLVSGRVESLLVLLAAVSVLAATGFYFEHLRQQTMNQFADYFQDRVVTRLLGKLSTDTRQLAFELEQMVQLLRSGSLTGVLDSLWIPIALIMSFVIHPALGVFVLLVNVAFAVNALVKFKFVAPLERENQSTRYRQLSNALIDGALKDWLTLNQSIESYRDKQAVLASSDDPASLQAIVIRCNQGLKWLFQIGLPSLGAILLINNDITIGGFLAALIVSSRSLLPFESLFAHALTIHRIVPVSKQLEQLLNDDEPARNHGFNMPVQGFVRIENLMTTSDQLSSPTVKDFSISAKPGDIVTLLGDASSGVNEPIRVLAGVQQIEQGEVVIDGIRRKDWHQQKLISGLSWLPDDLEQAQASVMDVISHFGAITESQALASARETGLNAQLVKWDMPYTHVLTPPRTELAARLQQLVSLTAAISLQRPVVLLEHPEQYLDMAQVNQLALLLKKEAASGKTIILSTSSGTLLNVATDSCLLVQGVTRKKGAPSALLAHRKQSNVHNINSARV